MTLDLTGQLILVQPATSGCSCCGTNPAATSSAPASERNVSHTNTVARSYAVTGMTCSHCVAAVSDELSALPGVTGVEVDLVAGGISTVTISSDTALTRDQIAAALDEAGDYQLSA
jgi:copper chaperone